MRQTGKKKRASKKEPQRDDRLVAAEERLAITNHVLAVAEVEIGRRKMTPEEVDEAVLVLGQLRHDYRVAERNLIRLRRELAS